MVYSTVSSEITLSTKTFVIDHPSDKDRYLVHACLEGPEAGVYYRGEGEIADNESTIIFLPDYVEAFASNFTVHLTSIFDPTLKKGRVYEYGPVKNESFTVYGPSGKFSWIVHAKRSEVEVEPLKSSVNVKGTGPYKWI